MYPLDCHVFTCFHGGVDKKDTAKKMRKYPEGEKVHKKGKVRFFGGWERSLIADVDEKELLYAILAKRIAEDKMVGDVYVDRVIQGHTLRFTQTQSRALLLHVKEVI